MAIALAGNNGSIKIETVAVAFLNNWKCSISGAELDTTKFGDTDKRRKVGLKSATGSGGGSFVSGDTTGQDMLWTYYQARTAITLELGVDTLGNKLSGEAIITKLNFADDIGGVATFTMDYEFDGVLADRKSVV